MPSKSTVTISPGMCPRYFWITAGLLSVLFESTCSGTTDVSTQPYTAAGCLAGCYLQRSSSPRSWPILAPHKQIQNRMVEQPKRARHRNLAATASSAPPDRTITCVIARPSAAKVSDNTSFLISMFNSREPPVGGSGRPTRYVSPGHRTQRAKRLSTSHLVRAEQMHPHFLRTHRSLETLRWRSLLAAPYLVSESHIAQPI
eukprot:1332841-Rhodomonas_salina.1